MNSKDKSSTEPDGSAEVTNSAVGDQSVEPDLTVQNVDMPTNELPARPTHVAAKVEEIPHLMTMAVLFEGGLAVLAITLGWFGFCDSSQPLSDATSALVLQSAFVWGLIATIPLLMLLLATLRLDWALFKSLRKTVDELLVPMFAKCTLWQIIVLALLAGFGEELLFRWCLQGGLAELLNFSAGPWIAAVVAGLAFGLCHFVSPAYALVTFVIGVYLGMVMVWSGTYLAPAFAHAFYDFVALVLIVRLGHIREFAEISQ